MRGGTDTFVSSIEHLTGSPGNDNFTGNGSTNELEGEAGNDTLIGLGGADDLSGGPTTTRWIRAQETTTSAVVRRTTRDVREQH